MADLPIQPDYSSSLSKKPRVARLVFGDGYEQRVGMGINTNPDKWQLTWEELTDADCNTLLAFFDGLAGVTAFTWQSPYSSGLKRYVCSDWDPTPVTDNSHSLSATIYQVFENAA